MKRYCRLMEDTVTVSDVLDFPDGANKDEILSAELAPLYVPCPSDIEGGWRYISGQWLQPLPPEPVEPEVTAPIIGPLEFKLLFTSAERIAIGNARKTDQIIEDFFSIIDDPRLKEVNMELPSTINGVDYIISKGIVDEGRRSDILSGKFQ